MSSDPRSPTTPTSAVLSWFGRLARRHGRREPCCCTPRMVANPIAAVLTGALMLEQLGEVAAARDLERAVRETLATGIRTPDAGGKATTQEVAAAVYSAL